MGDYWKTKIFRSQNTKNKEIIKLIDGLDNIVGDRAKILEVVTSFDVHLYGTKISNKAEEQENISTINRNINISSEEMREIEIEEIERAMSQKMTEQLE